MHQASDLIPLPQLRQELHDAASRLGLELSALGGVKHRAIHGACLDGVLPAQRANGRWYVRREDLPKVAETLGLLPQRRPGRPRKAVSPSNSAVAA